MPKFKTFIPFSIFIVLVFSCKQESKKVSEKSFQNTLKLHLDAVKNRDIKQLIPTISNDVILISPNGKILESKDSFVQMHRDWFTTTNWTWEPKLLKSYSNDSLGYAIVEYVYTEKDSLDQISNTSKNLLSLIFKLSKNNQWELIFDQNTTTKN